MKASFLLVAGVAVLAGAAGFSQPLLAAQASRVKAPAKPPAGPDRSTPEATLRSFSEAINQGQVSRAAACVESMPAQESYKAWDAAWQKPGGAPFWLGLSNLKGKTQGKTATVSCSLSLRVAGAIGQTDLKETVTLRKAPTGWLIVPLPLEEYLERTRTHAEAEQVRQLATLVIHPELVQQGLAKGRVANCRSNLKQLATGAMMLSEKHDYVMKLRADRVQAELSTYVKSPSLFRCPDDASAAGATSYAFNAALVNANMLDLKAPERTVMFYEGTKGTLTFRHDGTAMVAFASGQVKMVDAKAARDLIWKP